MKAKTKSQVKSTGVKVPSQVQRLFVGTVAAMWLCQAAVTLYGMARNAHLVNTVVVASQALSLILPLAFLTLGYSFARRNYSGRNQQLFLGVLIGSAGFLGYVVMSTLVQALRFSTNWLMPREGGVWSNFGVEWIMMLVGLALFVGLLGLWEKRGVQR